MNDSQVHAAFQAATKLFGFMATQGSVGVGKNERGDPVIIVSFVEWPMTMNVLPDEIAGVPIRYEKINKIHGL